MNVYGDAGVGFTAHPIIGLEIHVQLATRTKLFCGCAVEVGAQPNTRTCPVCLGHPGCLPVLNCRAVELAVTTGIALNCSIAGFTKWDRKSYFYPDLPKNYQISQYDLPIAANGYFEISTEAGAKRVRIRRAHLEEDAGKNTHDPSGHTLVDLNRAGTPLLEIVTEPDIASAEEAYTFCTQLQRLVTYLGVSEGVMQKGQMRFEPNVNVAIFCDDREFRTPIAEIKNLNSFRAVRSAIQFEFARQLEQWRDDPDYLFGKRPNENRGWVDDRAVTEFQREKEAAHDYRYFPDPDLLPVTTTVAEVDRYRNAMPLLPIDRSRRFVSDYGLTPDDADVIVNRRQTADLFEEVIRSGGPADLVGKQFVNIWLTLANSQGRTIDELDVDAARIASLAQLVADGEINKSAVAQIAQAMLETGDDPLALAKSMGLIQEQDIDATAAWVDRVLAENQQAVADARGNPKKARKAEGFLRGQVMKISGGKADPKLAGKLLAQRLSE